MNRSVDDNTVVVPTGHIVANLKWQNTEIISHINKKVKVIFMSDIKNIDFFPSTTVAAIYIPESDLVIDNSVYKQRIYSFYRSHAPQNKIVLVEINNLTSHLFIGIQKLVVLDYKLKLICFSNLEEVASALQQFVSISMMKSNIFSNVIVHNRCFVDSNVLNLVNGFKGVGKSKALLLLQKYKTVKNILDAPLLELEKIVSSQSAKFIKEL